MPVSKEVINILGKSETIDLIKVPTVREKDSILALSSHTETKLNIINFEKYMDFPTTIPIAYRKNGKIIGLIVGIPIEKFDGDETFPDPDISKRNTVYTVVFQYDDSKVSKILEKEYLAYLKRYRIKNESRHMRCDWVKGSGFKKLKNIAEWKVDGFDICYCKREIVSV